MRRNLISRRHLLRGAGGVAVGLPFLSAMGCSAQVDARRPGGGGADGGPNGGGGDGGPGGGGDAGPDVPAGSFPRRLLVFFSPEGAIDSWRPTGGERDFVLSAHHAPLLPFRDKLVVLSGLSLASVNLGGGGDVHTRGMGTQLSGARALDGDIGVAYGGGPSIDQLIADAITPAGMRRSLEVGIQVRVNSPWSRMFYRGPGQAGVVVPKENPVDVFEGLFAGAQPDGAARLRRRKLVVDAVLDDYHALGARLGADDNARLDAHIESLYEIESLLDGPGGAACEAPTVAASDDYRAIGAMQTELAVKALACDLTRVASIQWSRSNNVQRHPWLGGLNAEATHHDIVHNHWTSQANVDVYRWYVEQFANTLAMLDAIPEGDGTLLDNTCVLWTSDMTRGNRHGLDDAGYFLAGGAGGAFETGRYLTFNGTPHNRLLTSIVQMFGLDLDHVGDPELAGGPLPGLNAG